MTGRKMTVNYSTECRAGDNAWYLSDTRKFQAHYPTWSPTFDLRGILEELYASMVTCARDRTGGGAMCGPPLAPQP